MRSPFWKTRKKAIWLHLWSIQNEAIPLVAVRWQRIVIGLGKSRHGQTWFECRFSWNENLRRSKNWAAKSTILKENAGKVESVFLSLDQPNKPKGLDVALNIAGVEKYARKTCDCGQPGGHSIRVLNGKERKWRWRFVPCGRWFSSEFEIVSETPFSCDTVGRELLWPVLYSLLCRRTDWNIRIGKQGYVFILSDVRSGVLMLCQEFLATEKSWIY